jgi:hypothetical protein
VAKWPTSGRSNNQPQPKTPAASATPLTTRDGVRKISAGDRNKNSPGDPYWASAGLNVPPGNIFLCRRLFVVRASPAFESR